MPTIRLETHIKSDIKICFDLSRSVDLHKLSTKRTNEEAVEGAMHGLMNQNDFVTWEATHFFIRQRLTSKITFYEFPFHFRDEQVKGAFKYFVHDHYFDLKEEEEVVMTDTFNFQSPYGILGAIFDKIILQRYLRKFLIERNNMIKLYAETDMWKLVLNARETE